MKKFLQKCWRKLRRVTDGNAFVCDCCGVEIFEYPKRRICFDCEKSLSRIGERRCPKCGRETKAEGVCLDCKAKVQAFTQGFSPFVYRGETASLVNRMKNGKFRLALYFGEQMSAYFVKNFSEELPRIATDDEPFLLIPVPITEGKRAERGYNQAERLALSIIQDFEKRGIAAETDFTILQKQRENLAQKQMSSRERLQNVQGAYHVHKRKACRGRRILLIDDILTTGTTSGECAKRLLNAGAREVYLLVASAVPEEEEE